MRRGVEIGERFGRLTVVESAGSNAQNRRLWRCACDCGSGLVTRADSLVSGRALSCGCDHDKNLIGLKFGRLTVLGRAEGSFQNRRRWLCLCECGNHKEANTNSLTTGETKSCGCLLVGNLKHGYRVGKPKSDGQTSTYMTWSHMKSRCQNPNDVSYANWGGRGITVCDRWQVFANFLADMGERPLGTSLDRIDNNRGYEPGNCRWATLEQQARNKSNTVFKEYQGRTQTIMEWEDEFGMRRGQLRSRLQADMSMEEALRSDRLSHGRKHRKAFVALKADGRTLKSAVGLPQSAKKAYAAWCNMKARCDNPNSHQYADWGGRGITYCEQWKSFENFLADMGEPPPCMSLDRIDVNGNYCPENCRWASFSQQRANQRAAVRHAWDRRPPITWNGITQSVRQWAIALGISEVTLAYRLDNERMPMEVVMTPGKISRKNPPPDWR